MSSRPRVRTPVRLAAWFILATGLPLAILAWLGQRTLAQQREIARQRTIERLDQTAVLLAREVGLVLGQWRGLAGQLLNTAAFAGMHPLSALMFTPEGVSARYGASLLYYPPVVSAESSDARLTAGERAEFVKRDVSRAAAQYRLAANAADPLIRADALVGLARCLERLHKTAEALKTYDQLAALSNVAVAGYPAELIAFRERARMFAAVGSDERSTSEMARLRDRVWSGSLMLDRSTFRELSSILAPTPAAIAERRAVADAISEAWSTWQTQPAGATVTGSGIGAVVSTWMTTADHRSAAVFAPLATLIAGAHRTATDLGVSLVIDREDEASTGHFRNDRVVGSAPLRDVGLAAFLRVAPLIENPDGDMTAAVISGAFALFAMAIAAAGYVVFRSVSRDLALAGQQSEFVATVSHEFRSPLTAMRHLTESLHDGAVSTERLPEYYRALAKETIRLQQTVETVLAFGRLDNVGIATTAAPVDIAALVEDVVINVQASADRQARELIIDRRGAGSLVVHGDRDALALALRNLIDNAFKYSTPPAPVHVTIAAEQNAVSIAVTDHGCGLTTEDQHRVFRKFVRGSAAHTLNVKGTGLGLAIVDRVIKAHGGTVTLASVPRSGSTFTITLQATQGKAAQS